MCVCVARAWLVPAPSCDRTGVDFVKRRRRRGRLRMCTTHGAAQAPAADVDERRRGWRARAALIQLPCCASCATRRVANECTPTHTAAARNDSPSTSMRRPGFVAAPPARAGGRTVAAVPERTGDSSMSAVPHVLVERLHRGWRVPAGVVPGSDCVTALSPGGITSRSRLPPGGVTRWFVHPGCTMGSSTRCPWRGASAPAASPVHVSKRQRALR